METLAALLLALATIVAGAGLARWAFTRMGLPGVVGEILLGVALGPSLLAWAAPRVHDAILPASGQPVLQHLAWIGLVLFVFRVGLDMRWEGGATKPVFLIALGGLLLPFLTGLVVSSQFPEWFFVDQGSLAGWALVSVVLTVSALPVLARILEDLGFLHAGIGPITLGAATVDDVVAWVLMATVAAGQVALTGSLATNLLAVVAASAALLLCARLVRPRLAAWLEKAPQVVFTALLALTFLSAWVTEVAGLHAVLGPLGIGALVSRHPALRDDCLRRLGEVTHVLLLPVFFVVSGADVDLRLLPLPESLVPLVVLLLAASLSKLVGAYLGGRVARMTRRDALGAGLLLNARGAVGLVVAKVGLDGGLFSQRGYSLLVVVVALTTLAAPVLARMVLRPNVPATRPSPS